MNIVINWGINCYTGWGVVGINLLAQLASDPAWHPVSAQPFDSSMLMGMDPLRYPIFQRIINESNAWAYTDECVWIDPVGNDLKRPSVCEAKLKIGRVIVEKPDLPKAFVNLASFDKLLTGSTWNQEMLEAATGKEVKVIYEGIDPSLFCPGPRSGWFCPDLFYIFASGKVEFRKAQDVVLLAFKRFVQKRSEARLVTCWNSPFADIANGYKGLCDAPLWLESNGYLNVKRWAHDNGIDADKVHDLGCFPNFVLPSVLREMDVMLAPSRVESCTSLPVKEAMACAVPVIYGLHTGMRDLGLKGLPLIHNEAISGSHEYFFPSNDIDWYESDPEEIDARLEWVYQNREKARRAALSDSDFIRSTRTWAQHVTELKAWLKE